VATHLNVLLFGSEVMQYFANAIYATTSLVASMDAENVKRRSCHRWERKIIPSLHKAILSCQIQMSFFHKSVQSLLI
jgi:hypothetical protein